MLAQQKSQETYPTVSEVRNFIYHSILSQPSFPILYMIFIFLHTHKLSNVVHFVLFRKILIIYSFLFHLTFTPFYFYFYFLLIFYFYFLLNLLSHHYTFSADYIFSYLSFFYLNSPYFEGKY